MDILIISISIVAYIIAYSFGMRSMRNHDKLVTHVDSLSEKLNAQAADLAAAKATLMALKTEVHGTSSADELSPNITDFSMTTEQAETLRNTAQIMQDAAAPITPASAKNWDEL